jgi:hypothetical protein
MEGGGNMVIPAVSGPGGLPRFGRLMGQQNLETSQPQSIAAYQDTSVEISPQAEKLRAQSGLLRVTLRGIESEITSNAETRFEEPDRSDYLGPLMGESRLGGIDLSPEATAARILGGVQGYIYRAFMAQHPEATPEDFERFKDEVIRGFERGFYEARSILAGLSMLDAEQSEEIGQTEALVREGLEGFFAEEGQRLEER